ncbi:hypothetical protein RPATATE_0575 [Rickettsia parkeri str. Tate's Hell]|uniref:Uncharacterized protein n=1 Tax=Rickettsia parkeri str. Tate's Hell TaxID=1359189 RepID=A0ABR5DP71_RICPA|nr:hypothetical protein [Rickettsia parkeri]AFC75150.1 hypothetical protein MC1_05425 [Rickettsia parkeri str. Portsmouth]KJV93473.1 hypothetical protein RPAGB_0598 [Rickettsia parkeri str. Grand Bay]KJV96353.1 hypothetical protein RPAAT24_0348 [Rickettsia parkeri str. AT\
MNDPKYRTITFTEENRTANINISPNKITIGANQRVTFESLGNVAELILGPHSSVKVTDLNHKVFINNTNRDKIIILSGEHIAFDDNPYA